MSSVNSVNPTMVLKYIKRKLGASRRPLPMTDEEIMDTVFEETLLTFSNYYPYMFPFIVQTDTAKVDGYEGVYFINVGDDMSIIGVSKIFRTEARMNNIPRNYVADGSMMDMQLMTDIRSATQIPETFKFIAPNKVEVFPKYIRDSNFMLELKLVHPRHLATIPLNLREQFLKLAEYDVKIALYSIMKHDSNLNTAFGSIDLKLEDLENAEDKRDALLELWDTKYIKEPNRKKIFIY